MNLKLLGELTAPEGLTRNTWYDNKFRDTVSQLMGQSDIVRVTTKAGKSYFMAEVNMLCGVCDDCTEFHLSDIAKYEFYKA